MSEIPSPLFNTIDQAEQYLEEVREHYREEHGEYRGRRTPEQQLIAEVTADEARLIVDGVALGILSLGSMGRITELPDDYETEIQYGGFTWGEFRGEFERLLVGFGVLTNRLERDGFGVPGYADMRAEDRVKVASVLFSDFLQHNALRFGVDSIGIPQSLIKTVHTEDGGIAHNVVIIDKDKARTDKELQRNMRNRGYATGVAAHPAGKISPDEYKRLRREHPEMDKDAFDRDISFYTNVRKEFEERE